MVEIPQELSDFKDSLLGKTSKIKSLSTNLQSMLTDLTNATITTQNGIDGNYQSSNKPVLLSAFNNVNYSISLVGSSLSKINNILVNVDNLIELVSQLEERVNEIKDLENQLLKEQSKNEKERSQSIISSLSNDIAKKKENFEILKNDSLTKFLELKSTDITISIDNQISVGNKVTPVHGGTYTKPEPYIASNGKKVEYYIYVPDNYKETSDMGLHIYFPGHSELNNVNGAGLPFYLSKGQQSSGVVVCIQPNGGANYKDDNYFDAVKELSDKIVSTYSIDKDKISTSGHSMGGGACLKFASKNPNYFSVVTPVAGFDETLSQNEKECLGSVNQIVAITGIHDGKSYNQMSELEKELSSNMEFIPTDIVRGLHAIHNPLYSEEVTINGKKYANLLEFCLSQNKKS